jgi:D-glycero-alpha-D-manno-heptose-7-phosphate kinase
VRVRIPVRIDFAGGWSDVQHFSSSEGGATLSGAIDQFVEGVARWTASGLEVTYRTDIPPGSGLGASAALDVAWVALTNGLMGRRPSAVGVAEAAYRLEKALDVEGGKQDQYAAALGGFNHLRFGAEDAPADVERLQLDEAVVRDLLARLVLCYSGSAHVSGELHARVWDSLKRGEERVLRALRAIRDSVGPARDALVRGDLDELAELMSVNREQSRRLDPGLVTPEMDVLFGDAARAGAAGSKACGAGGGGCLVFLCRPGSSVAVVAALEGRDGRVIPFRFVDRSEW